VFVPGQIPNDVAEQVLYVRSILRCEFEPCKKRLVDKLWMPWAESAGQGVGRRTPLQRRKTYFYTSRSKAVRNSFGLWEEIELREQHGKAPGARCLPPMQND